MMKIERKEFEGNVLVTVSDHEVRIWVCKEGVNIFRFKALGTVHEGPQDLIVIGAVAENGKGCRRDVT